MSTAGRAESFPHSESFSPAEKKSCFRRSILPEGKVSSEDEGFAVFFDTAGETPTRMLCERRFPPEGDCV